MPRRAKLAAVVLGALVLTGCSGVDSGQAAVSDTFRISMATIDAQVRTVQEGLGDAPANPPAGLALAVTQRLVRDELIADKAAAMGVSVTPSEVEAGMAQIAEANGGQEALEAAALQAGIPADQLPGYVRTTLLINKLSDALTAAGDTAGIDAALIAWSQELDVRVSPRYGTWEDSTLAIDPGVAVVQSLSTNPATTG